MGNWVPCAPHNRHANADKFEGEECDRSEDFVDMSNRSAMSTSSTPTPSLRQNMMRQRKNQDPFYYYEVVEVLGVGSMGSVSKVKKRENKVGGSARPNLVSGRNCQETVFRSMQSFAGVFMRNCTERGGVNSESSEESKLSDQSVMDGSSGRSQKAGIFSRRHDLLEPVAKSRKSGSERSVSFGTKSKTSTTSVVSRPGKYEMYYALKSIHLNRVTDERFVNELRNEIAILKTLDHPHIVRPIETFEHRRHLFMVMELCSGGDLYSRDPYSEEEAARIVKSILSAVAYMHSHNITHRDLKYENIMFANPTPKSEIKVIDFGLSKKYGQEDPILTEGVGTIYTMAPEVLRGEHTAKVDLWSTGVLAFMLLSSKMPFYGNKRRHVVDKILKCKYEFKGSRWREVSGEAKAFVAELLQSDPDDRPTAEEALQATWLNKRFTSSLRSSHIDNVQATLETFSQYTELKKLALMVVAHKSTSEEIGYLRKVFQKFDSKEDGMISFAEFRDGLKEYGYTEEEMEQMFHGIDLDHTGKIRYTEFLAATIEAHGALDEERVAEAFDRLDSDDSGFISTNNLREILGSELPQTDIDKIIQEADLDKDNRISYDEFLALWDQQQEDKRDFALHQIASRRARKRETPLRKGSVQSMTIEEEDTCSDESCPSHEDSDDVQSQRQLERNGAPL